MALHLAIDIPLQSYLSLGFILLPITVVYEHFPHKINSIIEFPSRLPGVDSTSTPFQVKALLERSVFTVIQSTFIVLVGGSILCCPLSWLGCLFWLVF